MGRYLEPIYCDDCGTFICYKQWQRHLRTKKHKYNIRKILK